jgi:hypothetical protein
MTGINESRPHLSPEAANFSTFPQTVKSMISSLRIVIDQLDSDFKQARELIQEIAKRLDEGSLCERNQISISDRRYYNRYNYDFILQGSLPNTVSSISKWLKG